MDSSSSLDDLPISFSRSDDFVVISCPKIGVVVVEARLRDGVFEQHCGNEKGFQQIQAKLERELNSPALADDAVIELRANFLRDPKFRTRFPPHMFTSVEVVDFRGFETPEGRQWVRARDVEIRVVVYRGERKGIGEQTGVVVRDGEGLDLGDSVWELC